MPVKEKYRDIVKTATIAAGAIGVPGAFSFGLDVTAMSATWISMIVAIAKQSDREVNKVFAAKLTIGVLAGVRAYIGGGKLAAHVLHFVPFAGTLSSIAINSSLNALFTYKLGRAMSDMFDKGDINSSDNKYAAKAILSLVIKLPSFDEIKDIISMVNDSS